MLNEPIESLPSTSVQTIRKLRSLEIRTFWDLINYVPFRYENFSLISSIEKLQPGEEITVKGTVQEEKNEYTRGRITLQKIKLTDSTGTIPITWFNQPYIINLFKKTPYLSVSGIVKWHNNKFTLEPKEYELLTSLTQKTIHTGRLVPIYPEKRGLSSRTLREKMYYALNSVSGRVAVEFLPVNIIKTHELLDELSAYQNIHFPETLELAEKARERLSFDELFIIQLSAQLTKQQWQKEHVGHQFEVEKYRARFETFIKNLPFQLTGDQKKVIADIEKSLSSPRPMNRFLQGDVGSGKTVVAAVAAYYAYSNGFKALFMAPTEILAEQHFQTLTNLFKNYAINISLITGSKKPKINEISKIDIFVGTHALLNQKLNFERVGLVVIDEQHRFGVRQRALLKAKGINPHLLTMTATPIPRTVALTLYGELDLSTIEEMPKGRVPVKTYLVPKHKRDDGYGWIRKKIQEGDQAFIICPLIEESDHETMLSVKAATKEYEYLSTKVFDDLSLGLLHGRLKSKEKEKIMKEFKDKRYDILVSTSVVEVGIDIPNATVMVIEGADRYGLAQLHQLRGRVGRGEKQSYCLFFTEKGEKNILDRLQFVAKNTSGAKIAEYDFKRRGPGEFYGTSQHGYLDLNVASLGDFHLFEKTKKAVDDFMKNSTMNEFPKIQKRIQQYNLDQISRD